MLNAFDIFETLDKDSKKIFNIIQKKSPLTKGRISLMTKIPLTTLNRIIQPLEQYEIIVEANVGESTGGRKPVLFDVNPGKYYIIGIDISRTYTKIVITNLKMDIINKLYFLMDESCTPGKTVEKISNYITGMTFKNNIGKESIINIGLGTVGPLDMKSGTMTWPRDFKAPGWTNVPIKKMLESKLKGQVIVENGANSAALAEYFYGLGKGFENIAYFNCGVGIRSGTIASGRLIRNINNAEDSFGHMVIDVDGELCGCGNYGCIECYSSINSIRDKFLSLLKKGRKSTILKPIEEINYTDICTAAEEGDDLSKEVIMNSAVIFGTGLANYINLLNPNLIILSGPLIKNSKLFYDVCTNTASNKYYSREEGEVVFKRGGYFGDDAIAIGAAAMAMEHLICN